MDCSKENDETILLGCNADETETSKNPCNDNKNEPPRSRDCGVSKTKSKVVPVHILKSFSCPVRLSISDLSRC